MLVAGRGKGCSERTRRFRGKCGSERIRAGQGSGKGQGWCKGRITGRKDQSRRVCELGRPGGSSSIGLARGDGRRDPAVHRDKKQPQAVTGDGHPNDGRQDNLGPGLLLKGSAHIQLNPLREITILLIAKWSRPCQD